MKEFFGIGGYTREAEGYMSWQHLTFVTSLMIIMVALAIFFGLRYKGADARTKNKVLIISAIAIDAFEIFKIIIESIDTPDFWQRSLPLFLCSIQLITIPLAAFTKGRLKEASLDFVFIFGLLGAVLGTYAAGQNYASYPVLSFTNVVSGITHSISGFCALYIVISGLAKTSMKKKNIWITFSILGGFAIAALIANLALDYNYMFLMRGDGTPYDLVYNMVNGNAVLYPILVIALFLIYIIGFYYIYYLATGKLKKKEA